MRKHFLVAVIGVAAGLLGACTVEVADTAPCPADSYRDGKVCVPSGPATDDAGPDADMGAGDAALDEDTGPVLQLPLSIDEAGYVPSGYIGDGETPGAIAMTTDCPVRAGGEAGSCHAVTWTPGIGTAGFAGVFWLYPANNFGDLPGLELPPGATEVSFQAWGASGGETVEFLSGLNDEVDGYSVRTAPIELTTTPTRYAVSLCGVEYAEVVSAFGWVSADSAVPVQFFIDDIVLGEASEPCDEEPGEIVFPFSVDEVGYVPSGFFGDGETPGAVEMTNDCPRRSSAEAVGNCHAVTWTTGIGSAGFAGAFWQYPENNFGSMPGLELPAGATGVRFDAWGAVGGEAVNFFAGTSADVDGFNRETGAITLTTTPTEYEIDLRCTEYTDVAGAFGWGAGGVASGAVNFFVDNIRWVDDGDASICEPDAPLALPFWLDDEASGFVPSGFMGDVSGIVMDGACPMRGTTGAGGTCHRASWTPSAGSPGWAGVFWQFPEGNWGTLPGRQVAAGATAISFYAWGSIGGEVVSFGAGYADPDGFAVSTGNITLTATPMLYEIDLSGVTYTDVKGGFSWVSGAPGGVTIYIDDIHWK